jgi:arylsulfatase A-like enzyme
VFAGQGFTTAGFVANVQLAPRLGFAEGYGSWSYDNMADGDLQVDRVLAWLEQHKNEDVSIFLHMMDPHIFYEAPEPWRDRFTDFLDRGDLANKYNRWDIRRADRAGTLSDAQKRWIKGRYDGEISFMDHELLRLVHALDALPGRTMIVFHNDHGEEFWEHGGFEHNHSLYNELVQAVLWIRPPGGWANGPHRIDAPVSLVDIAPTLFSAADIAVADWPTVDGADLTPFVDARKTDAVAALTTTLSSRPLPLGHLMFGRERWGVVAEDHKYILHTASGEEELYNLKSDPGETKNLAEGEDTSRWQTALADATGWPVAQGWRMQFTGLPHESTLTFPNPIGRVFVVDPESNRLKRANLEWGERPLISPDEVVTISVSEDRRSVVLTPGSHGSGIVFVEGPTATERVDADCKLGHSTLWGHKKSSICSRRVKLTTGPMLVQETDEAAQLRQTPEDNTIEALQSLGYIE